MLMEVVKLPVTRKVNDYDHDCFYYSLLLE